MTGRPPPRRDVVGPDDTAAAVELEALLAYLKQTRGFDFTAYKRSSLMRRVLVRMHGAGVTGFASYGDRLRRDAEEFTRLLNTILINVTGFFRDSTAWDHLRDEIVPRLVAPRAAGDAIRVWSAGCASGEEAYSIAMLLAEALGFEGLRERVKIYATDVDEEALDQARQAIYTARVVQDIPAPLLERYLGRQGDRYAVHQELRRAVVFGRHDLIQDAPISRVDLLICRNCLMYFNTEAQTRILGRFHFALMPRGVLFLGKAETLLAQSATFEAVDVKRRLFMKTEQQLQSRQPAQSSVHGREGHPRVREAGRWADVDAVAKSGDGTA